MCIGETKLSGLKNSHHPLRTLLVAYSPFFPESRPLSQGLEVNTHLESPLSFASTEDIPKVVAKITGTYSLMGGPPLILAYTIEVSSSHHRTHDKVPGRSAQMACIFCYFWKYRHGIWKCPAHFDHTCLWAFTIDSRLQTNMFLLFRNLQCID